MGAVESLLARPIFGVAQVDRLLGLSGGTAKRWIDGYRRGGKTYPPVVRLKPTNDEIVTWGEFVETRLLSEYRDAGVPLVRMRPAVDALRELFHPLYPLAHARPFLDVGGRELVRRVQDDVALDRRLLIVVVRNDQIVLSDEAHDFVRSAEFGGGIVERVQPVAEIPEVVIDPLRQFGEPVVRDRGVRTDVIGEHMRAGEALKGIAELYELTVPQVEAAVRYELIRAAAA